MPPLTLLGSTYPWTACACHNKQALHTEVPASHSGSTHHASPPRTQYSPIHLGMLEDVHDEDGEAQAEDVGCKAGVEVGVSVLL